MTSKLRTLELFAGIGGIGLGLERTGGFEVVGQCEIDPFCRQVLAKHWPHVWRHDDIATLTTDMVDEHCGEWPFVAAGFPCQDASVAKTDGDGTSGARTGLFRHIIRLVGSARSKPRGILLENVPNLLNRGFGNVIAALAEIGYDAEWECISAREAGAPTLRERLFILAYPKCQGLSGSQPFAGVLSAAKKALAVDDNAFVGARCALAGGVSGLRIGDGLSLGMERRRIHMLGNSVVPQVVTAIGNAILRVEASR